LKYTEKKNNPKSRAAITEIIILDNATNEEFLIAVSTALVLIPISSTSFDIALSIEENNASSDF